MDLFIEEPSPLSPAVRRIVADIHERSATVAYAHIFDGPFPREETRQRWDDYDGRIVLARSGDTLLGFVAWREDELDALYVLPEAAGSGVGGRLIVAAAGVRRLWVLEDNRHARGFYEHRGWSASGRVRQLYGAVRELEYLRDRT